MPLYLRTGYPLSPPNFETVALAVALRCYMVQTSAHRPGRAICKGYQPIWQTIRALLLVALFHGSLDLRTTVSPSNQQQVSVRIDSH